MSSSEPSFLLYDVVEMKRPHPCKDRGRLFQIVRLGADVKITCLSCGRTIMLDRGHFDERVKRKVSSPGAPIKTK